MEQLSFSSIEKTISFYTRNDFAILNNLLVGNYDKLWEYARLAYGDNRGIIEEYERGERVISSDYDVKWLNCLKERLIGDFDDEAKQKIVSLAKGDISNILSEMAPSEEELLLFRTAWVGKEYDGAYPYSREYEAIRFSAGSILEIETISSYSIVPYREDEDVGSDFFRYEIRVPKGRNILQLDKFVCHNEEGEVLLPPMKCKVTSIRGGENERCRGIIALDYMEQLVPALSVRTL